MATLHRADGTVAVDGFSDEVVDLTDADREEIGEMPFDDDAYRDEVGAPELHGESGYTPLERLDRAADAGGEPDRGRRPLHRHPRRGAGVLTCRLVPDQDPARVAAAIARHVIKHCPPGVTVSVEGFPGGIPAYAIAATYPRSGPPRIPAPVYPAAASFARAPAARCRGGAPAPGVGLDTLLSRSRARIECFDGPTSFSA